MFAPIQACAAGHITIDQMLDQMPSTPLKVIRRHYCTLADIDETDRQERSARLGSIALERACRRSGGRFL